MRRVLLSGIVIGAVCVASGALVILGLAAGSTGNGLDDSALGEQRSTFLVMGRPIYNRQPPLRKDLFDSYNRALSSINHAGSCLIGESLHDSKIDWEKVNSLEFLNVCIFFVVEELRSVPLVKSWLVGNEFVVSESSVVSESVLRKMAAYGEGVQFSAALKYAMFSESLIDLASIIRPKDLTVSITFDGNSRPLNVNSGFSYK